MFATADGEFLRFRERVTAIDSRDGETDLQSENQHLFSELSDVFYGRGCFNCSENVSQAQMVAS